MDFLIKLDFPLEKVKSFEKNIPDKLYALILENERLVGTNVKFLKDLGITNYVEIFMNFFEIFLLDHSTFQDKINKYEVQDLIIRLEKNVNLFEIL